MSETWRCRKCGAELTDKKVVFDYMGQNFSETIKCCPNCARPMIPVELAEGRMIEVEEMLEEK